MSPTGLAQLLVAFAGAAEIDDADLGRFVSEARALHRPVAEAVQHAKDARAACEAMMPDGSGDLFYLYAAEAWAENGMGFAFAVDSDRRIRGGPTSLDRDDAIQEARHLGVKVDSEAQREGAWVRFQRDRTFAVWLCVHRTVDELRGRRGDVFKALGDHNGGVAHGWGVECKYVGAVLYRHYLLWMAGPPVYLPVR